MSYKTTELPDASLKYNFSTTYSADEPMLLNTCSKPENH